MMNEPLAGNGNLETQSIFSFKGVIFDMDGTLIESTEADYLAWKRLFAEHNKELSFEEYFPLIGMKSAVVVETRLLLDDEKAKEALAKKMDYFSEIVSGSGIKTVPYATILLKQLKEHNVKLALATSSRRAKMKMVLQLTDLLPYFGEIVTGDEVANSKPAPDIFLKAAEKLQLSPKDCVVIEDAANGVKAAKNAGMKCVAITTTHSADLLQEADLVIDRFEELDFEMLAEMLKRN
jgi:beta-phosphoglucomutase family hydrolase